MNVADPLGSSAPQVLPLIVSDWPVALIASTLVAFANEPITEPLFVAEHKPVTVIVHLRLSILTGVTPATVAPVTLSVDVLTQTTLAPPTPTSVQLENCSCRLELMTTGLLTSVAVKADLTQSTVPLEALRNESVVAVPVTLPPGVTVAPADEVIASIEVPKTTSVASFMTLKRMHLSCRDVGALSARVPTIAAVRETVHSRLAGSALHRSLN
ncbi:MAG TPA: hypothetical protein VI318_24865 [Baekduia sp.]